MKTQPDESEEQPLRTLLQDWRVEAKPAPRFKQEVWRRIDTAERTQEQATASPDRLFTGWLETLFASWRPAVAYVAVLLLLGGALGHRTGQAQTDAAQRQLANLYVQSVDPYQNPASDRP
jgi:hypothetical protein